MAENLALLLTVNALLALLAFHMLYVANYCFDIPYEKTKLGAQALLFLNALSFIGVCVFVMKITTAGDGNFRALVLLGILSMASEIIPAGIGYQGCGSTRRRRL